MLQNTMLISAEEWVMTAVLWLKLAVEVAGAIVIGVGLVAFLVTWLRSVIHQPAKNMLHEARLDFARYLALALELQLGADILSTAVAPSWDQIGKLAAIAIIRTVLNFFLQKELRD